MCYEFSLNLSRVTSSLQFFLSVFPNREIILYGSETKIGRDCVWLCFKFLCKYQLHLSIFQNSA